jgi:putative cell wall-binding protein
MPLLLVSPRELPEATGKMLQELMPASMYIAGGETAISSKVVEEISQTIGISPENIVRFAGQDR